MLLWSVIVTAQTIYLVNSDGLWRLNLQDCSNELITELDISNTSDIAFHPDGTLYGINPGGVLFTIDTLTGDTNFVIDLDGLLFGAMTCSKDGILYLADRNGEFWTYDPATGIATLLGNVGFQFAGDLTFFEGKLYMTSVNQDLIILVDLDNLSNSAIVMSDAGGIGGGMYGIVTDARDCNNVRFYGIISGNFVISEVDLTTNTSDTVCILDRLFPGATTSHEFKASDPIRISDTLLIHPTCGLPNGSISITAIGGKPPYQFSLNGGLFQEDHHFQNLAEGEFTIEVVDSRGCRTLMEVTLTDQEMDLMDSILVTDATCNENNGKIEIVPISSQPIFYSIDMINFQDDTLFTALHPGFYEITAMNNAGCIESQSIEVKFIPQVIVDAAITPTSCGLPNGEILMYALDASQIMSSKDGVLFGENQFISIPGGQIELYTIDKDNCILQHLIEVAESQPLVLAEIEIQPPQCGEYNGAFTLHIINGTGIINYRLDQSVVQTSSSFFNIGEGHHHWSAIDEKGCSIEGNIEFTESTLFEILKITTRQADCGQENGAIHIELSGSNQTISSTTNGVPNDHPTEITELAPGDYEIVFVDSLGCVLDTTLVISQENCELYIPNVFSPNGDGINDLISFNAPTVQELDVLKFQIFDRWGNIVCRKENTLMHPGQELWSGHSGEKECPAGVYTYIFTYAVKDGTQRIKSGDITLIR